MIMSTTAMDTEEEAQVEEPMQAPVTAPEKEKVSCGRKKRSSFSAKQIPTEVRLNYHREVPIERLKSAIPKPRGYLPPTFLPRWPDMPLESKLPSMRLPTDLYVLARGRLGERLYHNHDTYTIYDPYHQERVIKEEYNALHDPYAKNYLKKPSVQQHLMKQGLITTNNHVLCSQREFNTYRKYLSTLYNDDVVSKLKDQHLRELELHKKDVELKQFFEKTGGVNFTKIQNAKIRQRKIYEEKVREIDERNRTAEAREDRLRQELLEKRFTKKMLAYEMDEARRARLAEYKRRLNEKQAQAYQMQVYKENMIAERIQQDREITAEKRRTFLLEWMSSKWNFQEISMKQDEQIKEAIQSDFIERAKKRQKAVEHYRVILPQIVEKQKQEKERIWNLVKKYFYRWLNKVRERKARVPDAEHQSLWDITSNFDDTVKYLHKESGYEKLDDLIMGILKLKRDIKAELEREAAAEALEAEEEEEAEQQHQPRPSAQSASKLKPKA